MLKYLPFLLLFCSVAYGANATFEIKAAGGDYTSLQGAIGKDTTISAGDTCFFEISIAGTDSMTAALNFTGWGATGTIYFKVMPAYRYDGTIDTTNHYYWKSVNGDHLELNRAMTFVFDGFQINNSASTIPPIKEITDGLTVDFIDCYWFHCYRAWNPTNTNTTSTFVNNYFDSVCFAPGNGTTFEIDGGTVNIFYCTFYGNAEAIDQDGGILTLTNCLFLDTDDPSGHLDLTAGTQTVTYCITDTDEADDYGGAGNVPNAPPITFVDSSGGDSMLLAIADTVCIAAGTPIANWVYDVEEESRDATNPDVGYDEFTAAAGGAAIIIQ